MLKTEGLLILESQIAAEIGDKAEKAARPGPQSVARRRLADISNLPQKPRLLVQHDKSQSIPGTTKEYIEQPQMEIMTLMKMLAQRNKIIEQNGIELERLRLNLIKMQEQNRRLALSHTQMLAELNSVKDQSKASQHKRGCINGLLEARNLELQEKDSMRSCQHEHADAIVMNLSKLQEEGESSKDGRDDEKPHNTQKRLRSHSSGSSEQLQSEDNAGKRRQSVRRQSARFKADESEHDENVFGIDDTKLSKCPLPDESVPENGSTSVNASVENEDKRSSTGFSSESQESPRSSLCRPSRLAAKKEKDSMRTCQHEQPTLPSSKDGRDDEKPHNTKKRLRSHSLGASEPLQSEENAGKRRHSVRRQSARFGNGSTSVNASVENEDNRSSSGLISESQVSRRLSLCRPSRVAAKKVQSYKEIPLNVKMRRTE